MINFGKHEIKRRNIFCGTIGDKCYILAILDLSLIYRDSNFRWYLGCMIWAKFRDHILPDCHLSRTIVSGKVFCQQWFQKTRSFKYHPTEWSNNLVNFKYSSNFRGILGVIELIQHIIFRHVQRRYFIQFVTFSDLTSWTIKPFYSSANTIRWVLPMISFQF